GAFHEKRNLLSSVAQFSRQRLTVEDAGDRRIAPHGVARPVPFRRKGREKPSVDGAAKRNRSVANHEDVSPERITRPERLHRSEVRAQTRLHDVVCWVWWL